MADPHCGRYQPVIDRRDFLKKAGAGFGMLALADLLGTPRPAAAAGRADPLAPRTPMHEHFCEVTAMWLILRLLQDDLNGSDDRAGGIVATTSRGIM